MVTQVLESLSGLPPEIAVTLVSFLPLIELRGAIPVGMLLFGMPAWEAWLLAVIGNMLPVLAVYAAGDWWVRMTERRKGFLHRVTDAVLRRAHDKLHGDMQKWGLLALVIFVAIPLPGTGAWTGALGAFVFRIPFRRALPSIALGNVIAGVIVAALVAGGRMAVNGVSG